MVTEKQNGRMADRCTAGPGKNGRMADRCTETRKIE